MDEKIVCEVTYNARDGKERKNPHEPPQEVLTVWLWALKDQMRNYKAADNDEYQDGIAACMTQ
jgi:hypothetical protein